MIPRARTISRSRRGIESIEVMVALPLVLLVLYGGFEYGWMVMKSVQLDHAARVGAREASLDSSSASTVDSIVQSVLANAGISNAVVGISPAEPADAVMGDVVTVSIDVDYGDLQLLGLSNFMPLPDSLHGEASMIKEPGVSP
jgi:Flp pilus assembly protein TadG